MTMFIHVSNSRNNCRRIPCVSSSSEFVCRSRIEFEILSNVKYNSANVIASKRIDIQNLVNIVDIDIKFAYFLIIELKISFVVVE